MADWIAAGETGASVRGKLNSLPDFNRVPYIEKFGAKDARDFPGFDSTSALVAAAAAFGGAVRFTPGARYNIQGATIPRLIALTGQLPWNFDTTGARYVPVLQAPSDCAYVLRLGGDLSTATLDSAGPMEGSNLGGLSISGGGHNISDALLVGEGLGYLKLNVALTNAKGRALRLKVVWDTMLDDLLVRNIDGRGTTGIVTFDVGPTTSQPSSFWNCNNIRIRGGHFEELAGHVIRALNGCNLDSLTITGHTKFERGDAATVLPGGGSVSNPADHSALIWLEQCTSAIIDQVRFNRFTQNDGYDELIRLGPATGTGATGARISCCSIQGEGSKVTRPLRTYSRAVYDFADNSYAGDPATLADPLNGSIRGGRYERPVSEFSHDQQSRLRSTSGALGLFDIAALSSPNENFVSDPTAPNSTKASMRISATYNPFINLPGDYFRATVGGMRLGIEGYSATGAGRIDLLVGGNEIGPKTVTQTAGTRGMTWWTLTPANMAALNAGNSLLVITAGDNAEAVTISGAAFVPL